MRLYGSEAYTFGSAPRKAVASPTMKHLPAFLILAATSSLGLFGCGGTDSHAETATLRVVHASPNAPNVDVLVGNDVRIAGLSYFNSSTTSLEEGNNRIRVNAAGTASTVIDTPLPTVKGRLYTVLAADVLATINPIVIDDIDAGPGAGLARVRIAHASPSAGNVDVFITAPTDPLPAVATLPNVPFKAVSTPISVPSGSYRVRITPAGAPGTVAIDSGTITLGSNSSTIAVALDKASGGAPLTARLFTKSY